MKIFRPFYSLFVTKIDIHRHKIVEKATNPDLVNIYCHAKEQKFNKNIDISKDYLKALDKHQRISMSMAFVYTVKMNRLDMQHEREG